MLKAYYFLWRRPGMSRSEFIDYYENKHAALISANLTPGRDFRRNFPIWESTSDDILSKPSFDVLTAITYASRSHFEAAMHTYHSEPFHEIVVEDELRFIDRNRVKFIPVDEVIDGAPDGDWFPAPYVPAAAKVLRFTRVEAGLDHDWRAAYEADGVPAVREKVAGCLDYRRNYIRRTDDFSFMTPFLLEEIASHGLVDCCLVEEICFADAASATAAAQRLQALDAKSSAQGARALTVLSDTSTQAVKA